MRAKTSQTWMAVALGLAGFSCKAPGTAEQVDAPRGTMPDARPGDAPDHDDAMIDAMIDGSGGHPMHDAMVDARPDAMIDAAPPAAVVVVDSDPSGSGATRFADGPEDLGGPFFQSLGTNGRSCSTCHVRAEGWTVTPAGITARFDATDGEDPIFRPVDGATSPDDDVSTGSARQVAYAMLLSKGLFRIGLPMPSSAEFTLVAVDDPYNYASASQLSLFRRPLPATNLTPDPAIMWDLREPSLLHQATDATLGHAQAGSADPATMMEIVAFESSLATAQLTDATAGELDASGVLGGPVDLAGDPWHVGINDSQGSDPTGSAYDSSVFVDYAAWAGSGSAGESAALAAQQSIARGEVIFNTRQFTIANVTGVPTPTTGTCSYCHDTPDVGSHSYASPVSLGLDSSGNRSPDMPLYTLQRTSDGTMVQTTDPGVALISGKWADIGKFKVPVLRGLAMRPPYFHNGLGSSLTSVVQFYNQLFVIHLSNQDQADLVAFLATL